MALYHSPRVVLDGLESYLDAANTKSYPGTGTSFFDLTGKGNNGTLISSPEYVSDYNGGFSFLNNTSRRITVTTTGNMIVTPTSSFTISVIFEATELPFRQDGLDTHCAIYGRGATVGSQGIAVRQTNAGALDIFAGTRAVGLIAESFPINPNTVYNAVLTYSSSLQQLYVNGEFISSSDTSSGVSGTFDTGDWGIFNSAPAPAGNGVYATAKFYLGMFYSKVLTSDEVYQNFQAVRGRFNI